MEMVAEAVIEIVVEIVIEMMEVVEPMEAIDEHHRGAEEIRRLPVPPRRRVIRVAVGRRHPGTVLAHENPDAVRLQAGSTDERLHRAFDLSLSGDDLASGRIDVRIVDVRPVIRLRAGTRGA
ncbi:hypothetical protein C0Z20_27925 [Trinickia symbiotica]|uniref:Uncharacterized protein n=1 Tax=Trinickia symbiotica TaxID=863227 RepID=A0A2N7WQD5_9BURK|nr:hypothetical protein C0Z20_27925 [Trinickia symbiotica]